jgi:uncharacterized protein YdeI (YjbR/CyaY-like superfamily)
MARIDETFFAADAAAWADWLAAHHGDRREIWLLLHKKHVAEPCISYAEAVEEALCWGWVDGLANRWDERSYAQRFTPRKPGSVWAESNVKRVERLIADGRMQPQGLALVEEAKRRGTWAAATEGGLDEAPPDLEAALAAEPAALSRWRDWAPSHRRQYAAWVLDAKRPETRARRIATVVERATAGLRPSDQGEPRGPS